MREVTIREPCACSAATFWNLRGNSHWDAYSASEDRQVYTPIRTTHTRTPHHGIRTQRVSRLTQRWPPAVLAALKLRAEDLQVNVETSWCSNSYDEQHPCVIVIRLPILGDRFIVHGRLWVEPRDEASCILHSSYVVDVRVPLVSSRVETMVEKRMRATYADQPRRVAQYLTSAHPVYELIARIVSTPTPGAIPVEVAWIDGS